MNELQKSIARYGFYFEELKRRLFILIKIFATVFVIGVFSVGPVVHLLVKYSSSIGVTVVATSPFQMVNLAMSVGFFIACLVTIPIFIYHLYAFLKPALLPKEARFFLLSLPLGIGLFLAGFFYSSIMLYYAIKFISVANTSFGVVNYWDVSSFLSQVIMASIFFGLVFEFPIVLTFIIRVGLLKIEYLRRKRRFAYALIFIFVGLLPPPDIFSTFIQALPLIILYEITIILNSIFARRLKNQEEIAADVYVID